MTARQSTTLIQPTNNVIYFFTRGFRVLSGLSAILLTSPLYGQNLTGTKAPATFLDFGRR